MIDEHQAVEAAVVDGAAWIYMTSPAAGFSADDSMRRRVVEVCEEGGWPIVAWPTEDPDRHRDPGHLFEDVRHAVEHADCVVAVLGEPGETVDAELVLAYSHRRPIIGLRVTWGDSPASGVQAMLEDYERARVISCRGPEECGGQLRAALSDPDFGATIRQAAGERAAAL
jgi:hypothetical protein